MKTCTFSPWILFALNLSVFLCPVLAVSVYTIDHSPEYGGPCTLIAFDVEGDELNYRDSVLLPEWGYGAIDIAIDGVTNTLFVTFELDGEYDTGGKDLEVVDTRTLSHTKVTIENGVKDLTAIIFDKENRRLLATDRDTNRLHIIKWDAQLKSLSLEETIQLENIDYATDLAINENILYVSEFQYATSEGGYYTHVNMYNMDNGFSYIGQIETNEDFVSIDYNEADGVIYGGGIWSTNNLSKYIDPNTIVKDIGAQVICVATDDETDGRVFLTTYRDGVEMWDTANWGEDPNTPLDPNYTDIYTNNNSDGVYVGNLAGIVVGEDYKPPLIDIVKIDDTENCVSPVLPDPNYTYTIGIASLINNHNDVWVVDYLPDEVTFISASPEDTYYGYDPYTHTYTWYLPTLSGYDPNNPPADPNTYFSLTVQTNEWAEPLSTIINEVTVESDISDGYAIKKTDVCCWTHPDAVNGIIYVDKDAKEDSGYINFGGIETSWAYGKNTGTNWTDAYRSLQDALNRASLGCGSEIWIADGTYYPGTGVDDTFEIPDGVEVYGGFNGTETARSQRDWKQNKTILSGYVDGETRDNNKVVTMGDETVLDGFTVSGGAQAGVYSNTTGDEFLLSNCIIKDNKTRGVWAENVDVILEWSVIKNNSTYGISHKGANYELTLLNSKIVDNIYDGIYCNQSTLTIKNSIISQNGSDSTSTFYGINLYNPWDNPIIHNCTIAHNTNQGIYSMGSNVPDIRNCILFFNNENWEQLAGYSTTYYSCVQDPNDPYSTNDTPDGNGNIIADPNFAYDNHPYGYYHLNSDSPCKDSGDNSCISAEEVDIDEEDRDGDGYVDMGADEITCSDTSNPMDWTANGIVNLEDYAILAKAWLTRDPNSIPSDPNDPDWTDDPDILGNWNPICDINGDYTVDLSDFLLFCDEWLWQACWKSSCQESMIMSMSVSLESTAVLSESCDTISVLAPSVPVMDIPASYKDGYEDEYNNIVDMIEFLKKLRLEDENVSKDIKDKTWEEFMNNIYEYFYTIEAAYNLELKSKALKIIRQ
jgi:parallel beta-helix repeat protein